MTGNIFFSFEDSDVSNRTVLNKETSSAPYSSTLAAFTKSENHTKQISSTSVYFVLPILLLFLVTLGANLVVIVTICLVNSLKSVTSAFLVNLALCDLLIACGVLPLAAINLVLRTSTMDMAMCSSMGFLSSMFGVSSVLTLVAIAIDRYTAIIHCLEYHSKSNIKLAFKLLVWVWIQSIVCSSLPLLGVSGLGEYAAIPGTFLCGSRWENHLPYAIIMLITCFLVPVIVMTYCYASIIRVARQHVRRISDIHMAMLKRYRGLSKSSTDSRSQPSQDLVVGKSTNNALVPGEDNNNNNNNNNNNESQTEMSTFKKEIKATIRLLGPVMIVILCWVPYLTVRFVTAMTGPQYMPESAFVATTWLAYCNSTLNPLLYAASNRRFRLAVGSLLRIKAEPLLRKNAVGRRTHPMERRVETDIAISTVATVNGGVLSVDYLKVPWCSNDPSTSGASHTIPSSQRRDTQETYLEQFNVEVKCRVSPPLVEDRNHFENFLPSTRRNSLPPTSQNTLDLQPPMNILRTTISVENISDNAQFLGVINFRCRSHSFHDFARHKTAHVCRC